MTGSEDSACRFSQDFLVTKSSFDIGFTLCEIENLSDVSKSQSARLLKKE